MLTCRDISELVTDYLEGRLSATGWIRFQLHLGMCGDCRAYLSQMRTTVRLVGHLPNEPVPAKVKHELLARFRDAKVRRAPMLGEKIVAHVASLIGKGPFTIAVAFVVAFVGLILVGLHHGPIGGDATCISMELAVGLTPVFLLAAVTRSTPTRLSTRAAGSLALICALPAYVALFFICPLAHSLPHVLVYHLGGLVAVLGGGFVTPRLLSAR